jgi:hypothetical protein
MINHQNTALDANVRTRKVASAAREMGGGEERIP